MTVITAVDVFPIRMLAEGISPSAETHDMYGDYFIAKDSWTSIYSRHHETCLVRIVNEDGTVGWGEAQAPISGRSVACIVEDLCRPMLLGQQACDVEYLWYRMYSAMRERGHVTGFYVDALAGVNLALYDLLGRTLNLPVHRLLGGRFRDRIRIYTGMGGSEPATAAEQARQIVAQGYDALKVHMKSSNAQILEVIGAVRDAVGAEVELMVDVHHTRDAPQAIELGRGLESLGVRWLEAPTMPEDVRGHADVAAALDLQIATGEWLRTLWEWRSWVEGRRSFDVAMPDIARTGLSEGKRISALCDSYNLPIAPHVGGGGVLSVAASVQFAAAIPNFQILEHFHGEHTLRARVATHYPTPARGAFVVDDTPGLGIDIDEQAVAEFSSRHRYP
ncbi:MAG: mandelate racemase/muconate lactonizing enzyme family protein [Candidatus Latescibacterota bacterium]|nr:mandelate racemase/muconate lactonizing enzyme family protein [Candidatus Latescibacterota bacterium]